MSVLDWRGIGQGKQKCFKAEIGPEAMRAVKQALARQNIFNPAKILPPAA